MFTYPILGGGSSYEAFDTMVGDLLPALWYKFDDASFATTVVNYGSTASADLTSQNTTDASAGAAMRSGRSQSIEMPAFTNPNWATEAAHYTESADVINGLTTGVGTVPSTWIFTLKTASQPNTHLFTMGVTHSLPNTAAYALYMTGAGHATFPIRGTTGNSSTSSSPTVVDDDLPHILVFRNGGTSAYSTSALECWVDGTFLAGPAFSYRDPKDVSGDPFNIGGQNGAEDAAKWNSDCLAYWDSALTDTEIIDLQASFAAEL